MHCHDASADSSGRIMLLFKTKWNFRCFFMFFFVFFLRNYTYLFSQTLHHRPRIAPPIWGTLIWNHILGDDPTLQGSCSRSIVQSQRWRGGVEAELLPPEITASRLGPHKVITLLWAQRQTMEKKTCLMLKEIIKRDARHWKSCEKATLRACCGEPLSITLIGSDATDWCCPTENQQ